MSGRVGAPLRVGSLVLQPVSDGVLHLDPTNIFADAAPEDWQPRVDRDAHGQVELALNCLLVQVGDRHILVDTGYGTLPDRPLVGHLEASLAKVGLTAADIAVVVISHPHGDHIGGATTGAGDQAQLAYPDARYWLGRADWDHFSQPDVLAQRGLADKLIPLRTAERLDLADGEQEIAPGVRLLPLPGHTPGHMGVAFSSGQEMSIYVGDLIHHPLQIDHPDWCPTFDALPPLSRATRSALVERARREGSLLLSYHLPFPGIGRVTDGGWQPLPRA
jgi:glyoxylase-like metal-dependent hydrolase (beta-lactamase superfamily II)